MTSTLKNTRFYEKITSGTPCPQSKKNLLHLPPSLRISRITTLKLPIISSPRLPEAAKARARVINKLSSKHKTERANNSGIRNSQRMGKQTPRRLMTRPIHGVPLIRLGLSTVQINASLKLSKPRPMISFPTPNLYRTLWQPNFQISTMKKMSEGQPEVVNTGSGWEFSRLTP